MENYYDAVEQMYIYIPYYDREWHIQKADAVKVRKLGRYLEYCGTIYGETAYKTESAAQKWIDKDYYNASKEEYKIEK